MADFVSARNVAAKLCDKNDHPAGRHVLRGFSFMTINLATSEMSFLRSYGPFAVIEKSRFRRTPACWRRTLLLHCGGAMRIITCITDIPTVRAIDLQAPPAPDYELD